MAFEHKQTILCLEHMKYILCMAKGRTLGNINKQYEKYTQTFNLGLVEIISLTWTGILRGVFLANHFGNY